MGKVAKSKWVTFAEGRRLGGDWGTSVEVVHDGWLIHVKNVGSLGASFFLVYARMLLEAKSSGDGRLSISYLSEALANPGEEVLLHLSFNFADGSLLKQPTPIILKYGMGMGEYTQELRFTLPVNVVGS